MVAAVAPLTVSGFCSVYSSSSRAPTATATTAAFTATTSSRIGGRAAPVAISTQPHLQQLPKGIFLQRHNAGCSLRGQATVVCRSGHIEEGGVGARTLEGVQQQQLEQQQQQQQQQQQPGQEQQEGAALEPVATAVARVDVGYAIEQVSVPLLAEGNTLLNVTLPFPMGLVLEESGEGLVVAELTPGGAADAAQVRVGDVLRATTAATMQMTYPTLNLMFGGVGRPKLVKALLGTSGMPLSRCAAAIRSNQELEGQASVTLVLERCQPPTERSARGTQAAGGAAAGAAGAPPPLFDPRIFE